MKSNKHPSNYSKLIQTFIKKPPSAFYIPIRTLLFLYFKLTYFMTLVCYWLSTGNKDWTTSGFSGDAILVPDVQKAVFRRCATE